MRGESGDSVVSGRATGAPTFSVASWLFLRLLGFVYLFAFWSLALQIRGLIGHEGILPAREYMAALRAFADDQHIGITRLHLWPTLCWLGTSDGFLQSLCVGGAGLAALLVIGIAPTLLLPLLWVAYLSLAIVCRDFLSYQWDALLLETGLLAIPLAPLTRWNRLRDGIDPPRIARWLLWWLLFRLMFGSGVVKLASGDLSWRDLMAIAVHYGTQPLPTPPAWYASHLPVAFHKISTAVVLAIELIVPWFMVGPRRVRATACALLIAFQLLIALTGNYAFFNLLTIALCVLLLDDATFAPLASWFRWRGRVELPPAASQARWPAWVIAFFTVPVSAVVLVGQLGLTLSGAALVTPLAGVVEPFRSVNGYGLFAVMTTVRPEIIVEGSSDGVTWLPYEFKDKPGDLRRAPSWVEPFQPRLDWQMWFAALGRYERETWFQSFCARLLEGSPSVIGLLARDPFQGRPPSFVRGVLYQYHFADAATRRTTGVWWTREQLGPYSPTLSLGRPSATGR